MSSELTQLFDTDPLKLSAQDITTIVGEMRKAQAQFELGVKPEKAAKAAKPKAPSKADGLLNDLFGDAAPSDPLKDLGIE